MTFNAFEQFQIIKLISFSPFGLDLSLTNSSLFLILALLFFYFLYYTNIILCLKLIIDDMYVI